MILKVRVRGRDYEGCICTCDSAGLVGVFCWLCLVHPGHNGSTEGGSNDGKDSNKNSNENADTDTNTNTDNKRGSSNHFSDDTDHKNTDIADTDSDTERVLPDPARADD